MKSADSCYKHMFLLNAKMGRCLNWKHVGKTLFFITMLLFYCEVLIYFVVLIQCTWPQIDTKFPASTVKAMIFSDPHLLGPRFGHWFDKLRREWQMYRAFQTTMMLHNPETVFILGDIFDEGQYSQEKEFNNYVKRFHSVFKVPIKTKLHVVIGNHDIGFHYRVTQKLNQQFEKAFNTSSVVMLVIKDNIFISINSMALQRDNCFLCKPAEKKLNQISSLLHCAKMEGKGKECNHFKNLPYYSQPVLLQHFPLFRPSDSHCSELDAAPIEIRNEAFRETWECLSKESTKEVLDLLEPRVVFSGHTHHGCLTLHRDKVPEWTVSSFSWRNKNNPSFLLGTFAPDSYDVTKCYMPQENSVIQIYIAGGIFIVMWIIFTRRRFFIKMSFKVK